MNNLYLVVKSGVPVGVYSWETMVRCFSTPDWSSSNFKDNQWVTVDTVDCELRAIQVMVNQDMPMP